MRCEQCDTLFTRPKYQRQCARTFCSQSCYGKWQRGRTFQGQGKPLRPVRRCGEHECGEIHFGRGLCRRHYCQRYVNLNTKPITRPAVTLTCLKCGGVFAVPQRRADVAKFCSRLCACRFNKSGRVVKKGYLKILDYEHPRSDAKGYVFEHIVIAEGVLGRRIRKGEEIHHIDGNKTNNSPANLEVHPNHASHMARHVRSRQ